MTFSGVEKIVCYTFAIEQFWIPKNIFDLPGLCTSSSRLSLNKLTWFERSRWNQLTVPTDTKLLAAQCFTVILPIQRLNGHIHIETFHNWDVIFILQGFFTRSTFPTRPFKKDAGRWWILTGEELWHWNFPTSRWLRFKIRIFRNMPTYLSLFRAFNILVPQRFPVPQLWKDSLDRLLVKVARGVLKRCIETTLEYYTHTHTEKKEGMGTGWKIETMNESMYLFPINNGDFHASHVCFRGCNMFKHHLDLRHPNTSWGVRYIFLGCKCTPNKCLVWMSREMLSLFSPSNISQFRGHYFQVPHLMGLMKRLARHSLPTKRGRYVT